MATNKPQSYWDRHPAQAAGTDLVAALFADIVSDVRRKVIDEMWFGETTAAAPSKLAAWDGIRGLEQKTSEDPRANIVMDADWETAGTPHSHDPYDPWGWNSEPRIRDAEPPKLEQRPERDTGMDL